MDTHFPNGRIQFCCDMESQRPSTGGIIPSPSAAGARGVMRAAPEHRFQLRIIENGLPVLDSHHSFLHIPNIFVLYPYLGKKKGLLQKIDQKNGFMENFLDPGK
jgi:hypothetical protein